MSTTTSQAPAGIGEGPRALEDPAEVRYDRACRTPRRGCDGRCAARGHTHRSARPHGHRSGSHRAQEPPAAITVQ